jgi:hypothetical protein
MEEPEEPDLNVWEAISAAESILPGVPGYDGDDPRWEAIVEIGYHIQSDPDPIWDFVLRWGGHEQEDLRDAIACCLLEHLLEHHFVRFFPLAEARTLQDSFFADTFRRCWAFGQTEKLDNLRRFKDLKRRLAMPAGPSD